jgi:NAD(P)H-dependent FMN reductase
MKTTNTSWKFTPMHKKKVVAICGSTRQNSSNHNLIKVIAELSAAHLDITVFNDIALLPQFNPDVDGETVATEVAEFRQLLDSADGILICTPEYAHGVPGSLKNAIDWTVSSSQFPQKPTLLITASTDGSFGHRALLETLKAIDAKNIDNLQMVIPFVKTKISMDQITDDKTLAEIMFLIDRFIETMKNGSAE